VLAYFWGGAVALASVDPNSGDSLFTVPRDLRPRVPVFLYLFVGKGAFRLLAVGGRECRVNVVS